MNRKYVWGQRILGVALALVLATVAVAATYTLTLNAKQGKRVHKLLEIENARRAALSPPQSAITTETFINTVLFKRGLNRKWKRFRRAALRGKTETQLDNFVNP
jgi:hypothetical protein